MPSGTSRTGGFKPHLLRMIKSKENHPKKPPRAERFGFPASHNPPGLVSSFPTITHRTGPHQTPTGRMTTPPNWGYRYPNPLPYPLPRPLTPGGVPAPGSLWAGIWPRRGGQLVLYNIPAGGGTPAEVELLHTGGTHPAHVSSPHLEGGAGLTQHPVPATSILSQPWGGGGPEIAPKSLGKRQRRRGRATPSWTPVG